MATVIFIKESRQNPSAMRVVINYCQQEYKTFDRRSKRQLVSGINCDGANSYRELFDEDDYDDDYYDDDDEGQGFVLSM